ncbi:MAG TPA: hypothetical protein DCZ55_35700 [Cyanobacteria bacterium UBA11371]|nr:hypothetical protein [Cyanobacteria bacterium UBA11371]HBE34584.1 hypothetical protein [Cyanobacteria bacterium UBA11368]
MKNSFQQGSGDEKDEGGGSNLLVKFPLLPKLPKLPKIPKLPKFLSSKNAVNSCSFSSTPFVSVNL